MCSSDLADVVGTVMTVDLGEVVGLEGYAVFAGRSLLALVVLSVVEGGLVVVADTGGVNDGLGRGVRDVAVVCLGDGALVLSATHGGENTSLAVEELDLVKKSGNNVTVDVVDGLGVGREDPVGGGFDDLLVGKNREASALAGLVGAVTGPVVPGLGAGRIVTLVVDLGGVEVIKDEGENDLLGPVARLVLGIEFVKVSAADGVVNGSLDASGFIGARGVGLFDTANSGRLGVHEVETSGKAGLGGGIGGGARREVTFVVVVGSGLRGRAVAVVSSAGSAADGEVLVRGHRFTVLVGGLGVLDAVHELVGLAVILTSSLEVETDDRGLSVECGSGAGKGNELQHCC